MRSPKTSSRDKREATRVARAGFSLIETVIVIGLLMMIGTLVVVMGSDSIGRTTVFAERDLLVTLLTSARTKAVANVNESPHGVHIGADYISVFEGTSPDPSDPKTPRNDSISYSGPLTIVFSQLSGRMTVGAGTITLTQEGNSTEVEVNDEGRINW